MDFYDQQNSSFIWHPICVGILHFFYCIRKTNIFNDKKLYPPYQEKDEIEWDIS